MNSTGHYRRMLCAAGAAGLVLTLTGCSEKSEVPVKPVALGAHDRCALCGMVITNYEGPKAELFLKGVAEPVKFCSGRDAFTFACSRERAAPDRLFRAERGHRPQGPCDRGEFS